MDRNEWFRLFQRCWTYFSGIPQFCERGKWSQNKCLIVLNLTQNYLMIAFMEWTVEKTCKLVPEVWLELNFSLWLSPYCDRPYPQPDLPDGPSAKTSNNYYLTRDGRRMVKPNLQIIDNTTKQLTSGEVKTSGLKSAPKPGNTYNWDQL